MKMTSTFTDASPARSAAEQAVADVLDQMYAAWAAGDADAVARLYTHDATVSMPAVYHVGADAIGAWFAAGFAGRLRGSTTIDEARRVRLIGPDAAIVISTSGVLLAGEASVPPQRLVRGTWVLAREGGQWRIALYGNCPLQAA